MDPKLVDVLVCPLCKGPLQFDRQAQEFTCARERRAFPIRDGIPVLLEEDARSTGDDVGGTSRADA